MAALCRNQRLLQVPKSLFSTLTSKQPLPFPSFRAARDSIISEKDPEKLTKTFEECSQFPTFRRHRQIFHLSVHKLARAQRLDLIDCILQTQMKFPSDSPATRSEGFWIRLMMLYSAAGMVDHAMRVFDHVQQHKRCEISEKSLCAVLTVHLNNGLCNKVHELFENIPRKINLNPGVSSHNLVLKAFVKENDIESAKKWIVKMEKDAKVLPNIDSYNVILGAYLSDGDFSGFDVILNEILKKNLDLNLATYNYRISRLCKNKECVRAKKLLDEMVSKGIQPSSASYNTVIEGFCRLGDFESAKKVVGSMVVVSPCSFTYYTLIRSMVKEGEYESALEICKEIMKRKWVPPFEAMEGLVKGLLKISKVEEAKEIVEEMKKRLKGPAAESWGKIEAALPL